MTTAAVPVDVPPHRETTAALLTRAPLVVRVSSHVAVWLSVLLALEVELSHHWLPVGDNAAIASRAYQTFSTHPPLVGLLSTAGSPGHTVYDPGPLLFWLLTVPVHIDPTQGALWGAALLAGAALSLAVEAVWSTRLWFGCAVVGFITVDMFWLTPYVFENISWNAYFPLPFFIATLALAWVVGSGSFGWWPVLVFTASVAAQAHLLFSLPCAVLAVAAPVVGLVVDGRPRRIRWLVIGLAVGVACWIAPVLQQLFGRNGNLSSLVGSQSGLPKEGVRFSLSLFGRIGHLPPIWLTHQPTNIDALAAFEGSAGAATGVIVLALLVGAAVFGWTTGRRRLAVLACTCLVASSAVIVAISVFPVKNGLDLFYLLDLFWPLGVLIWVTVAWGVSALGSELIRKLPNLSADPPAAQGRTRGASPALQGVAAAVTVGVLVVLCVLGIAGLRGFTPQEDTVSWDASDAASVVALTHAIERVVPPGPVVFTVIDASGSPLSKLWISEGVGWRLESDGWEPGFASTQASYTGLRIPVGTHFTSVRVVVDGTHVVSMSTASCTAGDAGCLGLN